MSPCGYRPHGDIEGTLAVEGLSLEVDEGEFVAVVGPSGCGKSTLMKLATGLQFPTEGRVHIEGAPVTGPVSMAGMAFQNPVMLPWRTTAQNVLLPMEIVAAASPGDTNQAPGVPRTGGSPTGVRWA